MHISSSLINDMNTNNILGDINLDMVTWLKSIKSKNLGNIFEDCPGLTMAPVVFVMLLEEEIDLRGFGALRMPSQDAIEQAPSNVVDRLRAIKSIDLTKDKIGFGIAGGLELAHMLEVQCGY